MNEKTKTGLEVLEAAVLLGILGDVLLRQTPWGLNVLLWVSALAAAMIALVLRRKKHLWTPQRLLLHATLIFFAAMYVWRDSPQLKFFDALAILAILAILTLPALKIKMRTAGAVHYMASAVWAWANTAFAPLVLIFDDIRWSAIPRKGWTKHLIAVFRGLAIAAPLVFIFGALFMAADAVFEGIVEQNLRINPETLIIHTFTIGLITWFSAGYLRSVVFESFDPAETPADKETGVRKQILSVVDTAEDEKPTPAKATENKSVIESEPTKEKTVDEIEKASEKSDPKTEKDEKQNKWNWREFDNTILPESLTLGAIEISIMLGLVNLLFLAFVIIQIPYLFGGMELVQSTPDFKLAEYARRGFGELVTVAALVLPILLVSHWLLRKDKPLNEKIYRVLAAVQISLLFVIMASAAQRLFLLTGNLGYGLTTVRFYPMAFMMLLALVFVWFGLTVLRGQRQQFAWGALWLALFTLGTLHVLNPDDFIVRTNIRLMQEGRDFDGMYNASLSDDAVPVLLEGLPAMSFEQQCTVKWELSKRLEQSAAEDDIRSWNWSRRTARNLLAANAGRLSTQEGCPGHPK